MILVIARSEILETTTDYRNEHPLLLVDFGVIGGIYRVFNADLTPLLIWRSKHGIGRESVTGYACQ